MEEEDAGSDVIVVRFTRRDGGWTFLVKEHPAGSNLELIKDGADEMARFLTRSDPRAIPYEEKWDLGC